MAVETEVTRGDGGVGARLGQGLSGVLAFNPGQPLAVFVDQIGDPGQERGSRLRRCFPPPFGRRCGGPDGTVNLVTTSSRHRPEGSSRGRVDVVVHVCRGHRFAVDERLCDRHGHPLT